MHMVVRRRRRRLFLIEFCDFTQQQVGVIPPAAFGSDPARPHITLLVDQEFHVRWDWRIGLRAGPTQAAPEYGVGAERFLAAIHHGIDTESIQSTLTLG